MEATEETPEQTPEGTPEETPEAVSTRPLVATAGTRYRVTHYIMAGVILIMAAWFAYDGLVKYPDQMRQNEKAIREGTGVPHPGRTWLDVYFQRALAASLPFVGVGLLVWCLMQSRGQIRFEDGVLHVPGHPPVKLEEMRSIDNERWDKKGIALIAYETKAGKGTIKLDDYHYVREPVDKIQKIVTEKLTPKKVTAVAVVVKPPPPAKSQRAEKPVAMPPRPQRNQPRQ